MARFRVQQVIGSLGELLAVSAGFAVYCLIIGIVIAWIISLILISVNDGSRAALLFSARTLLPFFVAVGLVALFYRVIKWNRSKRGKTTPKKDGSAAN